MFFKDFGLISYDAAGKLLWKVPLGPFTNSMGLGASPIVVGQSVILVADQINGSYIAAFDRRNGEIRWKTARQESEGWGIPLLYTPPGSAPLILTAGQGQYGAHRVAAGKRLSHPGLSPGMVASPVLDHDTIYAFGYGADHGPSLFSGVLARLDKNHDGQLTPDEYEDIPGDSSDHQMTALFIGMGKYMGNGDGIITQTNGMRGDATPAGPLDCSPSTWMAILPAICGATTKASKGFLHRCFTMVSCMSSRTAAF